jgi:hypothetical protein
MVLGDISDVETNELINYFSKSVRGNLLSRDIVESRIFPVTHYIHVACYILYDQSYQYKVLKEIASKISPEEIARKSKSLGLPLNQLVFYSIAMLYLHGRAQVINDNLFERRTNPNIIVEPESKKKETKFILDFWRRLSPNYLNDGTMTVENKELTFLSENDINKLKDQMISIKGNREIITKLKQTIAQLTIFNYTFKADCRIGISEHGPYYFDDNIHPLIFKEFQLPHPDKTYFGIDISEFLPQKITNPPPIPNVIFGMTLKNMKKIDFNDWGTFFADPADFSSNITSIGIWTKELTHPKELRYPNKLGTVEPLKHTILDELSDFAKNATKELYLEYSRWDLIKKLMLGVGLYAIYNIAQCAACAGLEHNFNWSWSIDYAENKTLKNDLIDKDKITFYIEKLKRWDGLHIFVRRIMRGIKERKGDPFYYYLQD